MVDGYLGHVLFHGPRGCGKRMFIKCLLRDIYTDDDEIDNVRQREHCFTYNETTMKIDVNESKYHYEITLQRDSFRNVLCFIDFLNLPVVRQSSFQKVVVVYGCDVMSPKLQDAFRCLLDTNCERYRFFFSCSNMSRLKHAFRSRCFAVRIPTMPKKDLVIFLSEISTKECGSCDDKMIQNVVANCERNVFFALLLLEKEMSGIQIKDNSNQDFAKVFHAVLNYGLQQQQHEQELKKLLLPLRQTLHSLLEKLPLTTIFKKIISIFTDHHLNATIADLAAVYDHLFKRGGENNPVMFLEAFVLKILFLQSSFR